jgi:ATP-dependent Lhr-like helicase
MPLDSVSLSSAGSKVREFILEHGASFFEEIVEGTRRLPTQVEAALAELIALGQANSDSFDGLRALLATAAASGSDTIEPIARTLLRR